jgi:hypothetical protein
MVWFFARGNEAVRVETRFDNASREYVLEVGWANRPLETERFRDHPSFEARVASFEARLRNESWAQVGGPEILPDGWRGPFTN